MWRFALAHAKQIAVILWISSTATCCVLVFIEGTGYAMNPAVGKLSDAEITRRILFRPPYALLLTWVLIISVCLLLAFAKTASKQQN